MSTQPKAGTSKPASNVSAGTATTNPPTSTAGPANPATENAPASPDWESEKQLVSSLWKLQELEAKINQLRTLLPDRLLAPLLPIVEARKGGDSSSRSLPQGPEILQKQLAKSATAGVAEVEAFKAQWQGREMKGIWDWMDAKLKEADGDFPQPVGMWERDYDVILKDLEEEEIQKEQLRKKEEEQKEKARILSAEGDRNAVVESLRQRDLPGVRILQSANEAVIVLVLLKAGMAFEIQEIPGSANDGIPDWEVAVKHSAGQPNTKLETAIISTLNDRPRKWDLAYLLEMISAYSDIKQKPCQKCNKMTDDTAQLPTVRRATYIESADGNKNLAWEAYHPSCA